MGRLLKFPRALLRRSPRASNLRTLLIRMQAIWRLLIRMAKLQLSSFLLTTRPTTPTVLLTPYLYFVFDPLLLRNFNLWEYVLGVFDFILELTPKSRLSRFLLVIYFKMKWNRFLFIQESCYLSESLSCLIQFVCPEINTTNFSFITTFVHRFGLLQLTVPSYV